MAAAIPALPPPITTTLVMIHSPFLYTTGAFNKKFRKIFNYQVTKL
jgi:hypothetical protein